MSKWPFDPHRPGCYEVILADPPWAYAMRSAKGYAKSPKAHYRTMAIEDIKALPVGELAARHCMLIMWSTWPHLRHANEVMDAWGFDFITGGAWVKRTKNWKACFGTGFVLRSATEPFLFGRIGRPRTTSRSERNLIDAPDSIEALRREHSRKPDEMRRMIERLFPTARKIELFAREPWPGNDVWGNQVDLFCSKRKGAVA